HVMHQPTSALMERTRRKSNLKINPETWSKGSRTAPLHLPKHVAGFGPNFWRRMPMASLVVPLLQWGTSGAAIMIIWYTPTVGIGSSVYINLDVTCDVQHPHSLFGPSKESRSRLRKFGRMPAVVLRIVGK